MTEPLTLREIADGNRDAVLALRTSPDQQQFVGTVRGALMEASEYPQASPWFRAIYAGDEPVGFVMLSWNVTPQPPHINGPWFLWKLLIDERHQGKGHGSATVRSLARLVRGEGATELLTSYVEGEGEPWPFYQRLGFVPTGKRDPEGEVILRLPL